MIKGVIGPIACPCCKVEMLTPRLIACVEKFVKAFGEVSATSGYRCPKHNASLAKRGYKASPTSRHCHGQALDLIVPPERILEAQDKAKRCGFNGIGLYDWGIHVDVRPYPAFWDYRTKKPDAPLAA